LAGVEFHPAELGDVDRLAAGLRLLDRQELDAIHTEPVDWVIDMSIRLSFDPIAAVAPEGLVCLFGVAPVTLLSDTAAPWLLGTDLMTRRAREALRTARGYLVWARQRYPRLVNHVDARNTPSVRWLSALGFTIDPALPYGRRGLPFHRFHMGFDDV
jgi:hypothetical protein